jgi:hypothetical protein
MVWELVICKIMKRSGSSNHRDRGLLIRLDEVYKFAKYEAPFGAACGHCRWSREGKKLVVTKLHLGVSTIATWSIKILHHRNRDMRDRDEFWIVGSLEILTVD